MKIEIEESAIDTLRDMVQKLQDERDAYKAALQAAVKYHENEERFCPEWLVLAWQVIAKHTTEPKVMV